MSHLEVRFQRFFIEQETLEHENLRIRRRRFIDALEQIIKAVRDSRFQNWNHDTQQLNKKDSNYVLRLCQVISDHHLLDVLVFLKKINTDDIAYLIKLHNLSIKHPVESDDEQYIHRIFNQELTDCFQKYWSNVYRSLTDKCAFTSIYKFNRTNN